MKIGIIADVHANEEALRAVLADGQQQGVERWWFLGDAVGRGPSPVQTVNMLKKIVGARRWIAGNHDLYVTGALIPYGVRAEDIAVDDDHRIKLQRARGGIWRWCKKIWTLERARSRKITTREADIWLVHAMLDNAPEINAGNYNLTYIMPWDIATMSGQLEKLQAVSRKSKTAVLIHGHTHIPYLAAMFYWENELQLMPIRYDSYFELSTFKAVFINPGSVGQPRNGDSMVHAAYGILETSNSSFMFRRVPYDCRPTCKKMEASGYAEYLVRILEGNHPDNPIRDEIDLWKSWSRVYEPAPWGWRVVVE